MPAGTEALPQGWSLKTSGRGEVKITSFAVKSLQPLWGTGNMAGLVAQLEDVREWNPCALSLAAGFEYVAWFPGRAEAGVAWACWWGRLGFPRPPSTSSHRETLPFSGL